MKTALDAFRALKTEIGNLRWFEEEYRKKADLLLARADELHDKRLRLEVALSDFIEAGGEPK